MNLYVCSTPYHLFVTLCDIANKDVKVIYIYPLLITMSLECS